MRGIKFLCQLVWIQLVQYKYIEAIRKKVQCNRFGLTLTAKFIATAGANQQTWSDFIITPHLRQIVRQIGCKRCIAAVFAKRREIFFYTKV